MSIARMIKVNCLECDEPIQVDSELMLGEVITCDACLSELEVVSLNPIKLEFFYEGDWDDEDDEDDDWDDDEA
jgi:lysine biosynthesis protein LysW